MVTVTSNRFDWVPAGDNWRHNALVGQWHHDDATLARGFKRMADLAVQELLDKGPDDGLFAPITYAYRHAVELLLKESLREAWQCLDHDGLQRPVLTRTRGSKTSVVTPDRWLTTTHNLNELADELDTCLAVLRVHPGDKALPSDVTEPIRNLHMLDPKGDAFRYSEATNDEATTFRHTPDRSSPTAAQGELVNVEQLREVCGNVITHLSGAVDVFIMYREPSGSA